MNITKLNYVIPTFFLPALINDDYSGLTDDEECAIIAFLADSKHDAREAIDSEATLKPVLYQSMHWSYDSESDYFCKYHDVHHLIGACVCTKVELVVRHK